MNEDTATSDLSSCSSAMTVATLLRGTDPEDVLERRSVIRYLVLSQHHQTGFMTWDELEALNGIDIPFNKYWAPIQWAMTICYNKHEKDKMAPALLNNLLQSHNFSYHVYVVSLIYAVICKVLWLDD
uniref:Bestrophin homolog n=1 Tax=Heterorhabditis bacteriophora TaxID=37862 RepID=A0A1I7XH94_HETBA